MCMLYFIMVLYEEMGQINAALTQNINIGRKRNRKDRFPKKSKGINFVCNSCRLCCSSGWDCFDITSALMSMACITASWVGAFVIPLAGRSHADVVQTCIAQASCFTMGRFFMLYLHTFLTVTGVMNVICVFKYTRYHAGMKVFTMLFYESWLTLRDFIPWFVLLMFTQAWFICTMYSGLGTNKDMIYSGGALSVVLRLVFGFYDYDAFISKNIGLGTMGAPGAVVFWVCVVLGIVVAQNVMLAIVGQAYDNIQQQGKSLTTSVPLWTTLRRRIRWGICRRYHGLDMRVNGKEQKVDGDLSEEALSKKRADQRKKIRDLSDFEKRWFAVSCVPGIEVLSYYFTDFGLDETIAYPKAFWPPDYLKQGFSQATSVLPNTRKDVNQDVDKHILSQEHLSKMLWELWHRQQEDALDMFEVQNCCCFLRFGRWGPSEFKKTSNNEPPWNPDDLCIAILHGFGETEAELNRVRSEADNKEWASIIGSGSASQHGGKNHVVAGPGASGVQQMDQSVIGLFKKDEWVPIVSSRTKDSGFSTELSRNVRQWEAGDTAVEEKTGDLNRDNKESIQIEQLLIGMLTEMKTEMTEIKKELADMKSRLDDQQAGSGGGDGGDGGDGGSGRTL